jgi:hypothetical protein
MTNHPDPIDDAELIETVELLAENSDRRDLANAGAPAKEVAAWLGYSSDAVNSRLSELAADDKLAKCYGIDPRTGQHRPSYLPADHPDA